ncbi:sigma-70 family RNA polymerase sigma factor [Roseibium sp.]|uniref:sigma-70 family RNA polymerase sigma factor n=1 Tax=Roseibium sp. TaxID=1936156 RepID=UPI001B048E4F|nr:sigma-70 family RNA polymerase sigma factor [Roseibium sp.]MBO6856588.1 sigma-70 family RNA polymerase sigma factor [Roseibium sp.]
MPESVSEVDHAALLAACARKDRQALRQILELEGPKMLGIAKRMLRRQDLAEDALQDALVLIWRKASQFDPAKGSGRAWIFAVLRNRTLNMLRDGAREAATDDDKLERQIDGSELNDAWEMLGHDSELRRCLGRLETEKRSAVLMSYIWGYTHGEIAGRLSAPLGTVKAWVRRGLTSLRECMS